MMRSLYSGVSGLRVHQTKMDVIGNNISNVNTVGFKASTVTFSDILYQTTKSASGPNPETGMAGTNAQQIGLGASLAAITTNITKNGGSQRTDKAFDLMIEGDGFFVVNSGKGNFFTKAGSFNTDAAGTLCTPTGAKVMGWQPDPNDPNKCVSDTVSPLNIMSPENLYSEPQATEKTYFHGNIDSKDTALKSEKGKVVVASFFDNLGNSYNAEFKIEQDDANTSLYKMTPTNIYDSTGKSILVAEEKAADGTITYKNTHITKCFFGADTNIKVDAKTGEVEFDKGIDISFNPTTGKFENVGAGAAGGGAGGAGGAAGDNKAIDFEVFADHGPFKKISMDFSSLTMFSNSGTTTVESTKGDKETGLGAGKAVGNMSGVSIDQAGKIFGVYDNGDQKLLGQVVVAKFSNPAGLESVGNNMFAATQNSGEFNGMGEDITTDGGKFTTGVLEMSNVDLSQQFTDMIVTQRGFQANSRIITTSDTMLEELINLKR